MPTYVCSTAKGALDEGRRSEIARLITDVHAEEGRAPRYLVQVLFQEVGRDCRYIGGEPARDGAVWIRGDIRSGRTDLQKQAIMVRIATAVAAVAGVDSEDVWVYLSDVPSTGVLEYGRVLPPPGQEDAWLASLPGPLQVRLRSLS